MYDISQYQKPSGDEIKKKRKNDSLTFEKCAKRIFSYLSQPRYTKTPVLSLILRSLDLEEKESLIEAITIDFKYFSVQNLTKKYYQVCKYPKIVVAYDWMESVKLETLKSFSQVYLSDSSYLYDPNDSDTMSRFNNFLSCLPCKIRELETNFDTKVFFKESGDKTKKYFKRDLQFSELSKDFIQYCFKNFNQIPYPDGKANELDSLNLFLKFDEDIESYYPSTEKEHDKLFLLYDIEQHFMPYCMSVIHSQELKDSIDDLIEKLKVLSAPMTRLVLTQYLVKFLDKYQDKDLNTYCGDPFIKYSYESNHQLREFLINVKTGLLKLPDEKPVFEVPEKRKLKILRGKKKFKVLMLEKKMHPCLNESDLYINTDRKISVLEISNELTRFISIFGDQFFWYLDSAFYMEFSVDQLKKETNVFLANLLKPLHSYLSNKNYQIYYKSNYKKIMNDQRNFYANRFSINKELHDLESRINNE